jgi:hypothetical protein
MNLRIASLMGLVVLAISYVVGVATPSSLTQLEGDSGCPETCPATWEDNQPSGNCCFTFTMTHPAKTDGDSETVCSPEHTCTKCKGTTKLVANSAGCGVLGLLTWHTVTPTADSSGDGNMSTLWRHETKCDSYGDWHTATVNWTPLIGATCSDMASTRLNCGCG